MSVKVEFVPRSDPSERTRMRNTMSGWIEEREPEGFVRVTLEDGFHMMQPADEWVIAANRDLFVDMARAMREQYLADQEVTA